jgi:hypothetical protein
MIATNDLVIKAMAALFALSLNHDRPFRKNYNSLLASEMCRELEIGLSVIPLHQEISRLHLDFEDLSQVSDCLLAVERNKRNFVSRIIS